MNILKKIDEFVSEILTIKNDLYYLDDISDIDERRGIKRELMSFLNEYFPLSNGEDWKNWIRGGSVDGFSIRDPYSKILLDFNGIDTNLSNIFDVVIYLANKDKNNSIEIDTLLRNEYSNWANSKESYIEILTALYNEAYLMINEDDFKEAISLVKGSKTSKIIDGVRDFISEKGYGNADISGKILNLTKLSCFTGNRFSVEIKDNVIDSLKKSVKSLSIKNRQDMSFE